MMIMSDAGFTPLYLGADGRTDGFRVWSNAQDQDPAISLPTEDSFTAGFEQGQQVAQAWFAVERERLTALLASADQLQPIDMSALAPIISDTVERLVREIAGNAPVDRDLLVAQIDEVLAMAGQSERKTLRLHPDDAALLADVQFAVDILPDPEVTPGSMCLQLGDGAIEYGRATLLAALDTAVTAS